MANARLASVSMVLYVFFQPIRQLNKQGQLIYTVYVHIIIQFAYNNVHIKELLCNDSYFR